MVERGARLIWGQGRPAVHPRALPLSRHHHGVAAHAAGGGKGRADPHIETMMGGGLQICGPDQHVQPAVRGDGNVAGHRRAPVSAHQALGLQPATRLVQSVAGQGLGFLHRPSAHRGAQDPIRQQPVGRQAFFQKRGPSFEYGINDRRLQLPPVQGRWGGHRLPVQGERIVPGLRDLDS